MSDEQNANQEEQTDKSVEEPVEEQQVKSPVDEVVPVETADEVAKVEETPSKLENFDRLRTGQTIRVHERIIDVNAKGEERQRIQVFEGIILGIKSAGISRTMTVRKVSGGVGVEKIYPVNSPAIAKIELVKYAKVRRAKLDFLKNFKRRWKRKLKETHLKK